MSDKKLDDVFMADCKHFAKELAREMKIKGVKNANVNFSFHKGGSKVAGGEVSCKVTYIRDHEFQFDCETEKL